MHCADDHISERTCVKIPMTEEGAAAAAILSKEGIFTLGTCLFSIPQAIAASQAGMHAVSMYWNGKCPLSHAC
jgi:transaldolase